MPEKQPQSLANHGRMDPWFHFVVVPLLLVCLIALTMVAIRDTSAPHIWLAVLAFGLLNLALLCRRYALKVQDRVIRLEERLRLAALLPAPLRARIPEITEAQLIALRFAADEEIPTLVEKTLRENLDGKQIKKAIDKWRPDYWRV